MRARTAVATALAALFAVALSSAPQPGSAVAAEKDKPVEPAVKASVHDYMEALFQGPYKRLKAGIAAEPKDNVGWKVIRSEALTMSVGSDGLLTRKPEKDADEWTKYSVASRDAAADVYKAAKAKDFPAARKAYEAMLGHCNACHKKFDDGNHQLTP